MAFPAHAEENRSMCTERVELPLSQARELVTTLKSEKAALLEQIFAFETLGCARRESLRQMALKTAVTSAEDGLRAAALLEAVMLRNNLLVEFTPGQNLGKKGVEWIKSNGSAITIGLSYHKRALGSACTNCCPCYDHVMNVTGTRVTVKAGYDRQGYGEFKLKDNGTMTGSYYIPGVPQPIKATLKLF